MLYCFSIICFSDKVAMRILHTADWHIGQTLNGWTREAEHEIWFEHLADMVLREEVDVLLVAGDIYDVINPSGASQRLFYATLRRLKDCRPNLVTIITSGNHDPIGRLEAPSMILENLDVHVMASLRRRDGEIDPAAHLIPLTDAAGTLQAWICAIPFLRAADLPGLSFSQEAGRGSPIVDAARRLHARFAEAAEEAAAGLPVIAMGHLHCQGGSESEGAERHILIGNEHALPADVFPDRFAYVALGHLHRPQTLGNGRIRYSGSCFPLSAAEAGYDHGATLIEIENGQPSFRHVSIPRPSAMLRFPAQGTMSFAAFEDALGDAELDADIPKDLQPFVYVNLEATGPAAVLLSDAERLLAGYPVRIAGIRVRKMSEQGEAPRLISLTETTPEHLFRITFEKINGVAPQDRHVAAFREALQGE